jgi:uncharacterized protein YegL
MKHVIIILDTSYSMKNHLDKIITGINSMLNNARKNPDDYLSLIFFNTNVTYIYRGVPVLDSSNITYDNFLEFGCTALYDTVGDIVSELSKTIMNTVLYIITDGQDTSSKKYTKKSVDKICDFAIKSGRWKIVHCSSADDLINVTQQRFNINDIDSLLKNLMI